MVRITNRAAVLVASLAVAVNADLSVTNPSSSSWWVAKSNNVIAWTCNESTHDQFTILIDNVDINVQAAPQAIVSIENNFDCSLLVTSNQVNQNPGTGWRILLADIFNNTNVYATSDPFEIKPLGSAYPSQTTPTANATASNTANSDTAANTNKPSSAMGLKAGISAICSVVGAVAGFML